MLDNGRRWGLAPLLVAGILTFTAPAYAVDCEYGGPRESAWDDVQAALAILEQCPDAAKRDLLAGSEYVGPLVRIGTTDPGAPRAWGEVIERLVRYAAEEDDGWILYRVAERLVLGAPATSMPFFESLVQHPVPSVRLWALSYVAVHREDTAWIEALWREESAPEIRAFLARSARGNVPAIVSEAPQLMWHENRALAEVAIDAVTWSGSPDRFARLLERGSRGAPLPRRRALAGLAAILRYGAPPPDAETREALLERARDLWATESSGVVRAGLLELLREVDPDLALELAERAVRSGSTALVRAAVETLQLSDEPAALDVLAARAADGPPTARVLALRALARKGLAPSVRRVLLASIDPQQPLDVRRAALRVLTIDTASLIALEQAAPGDDAATALERARFSLPLLLAMAEHDPDEWLRTQAGAAHAILTNPQRVRTFVSDGSVESRFWEWTIEGTSLRCFRAPYIEHAPEDAARMPPTHRLAVRALFDDGRSAWIEVRGDGPDCWIPAERLTIDEDPALEEPASIEPLLELDVAQDVAATAAFRELESLGWVERFDPGETLVGVRLRVESGRTDRVDLLHAHADRWHGTQLGAALRALLPPAGWDDGH